jgi:hypothetical protein
MSLEKDNSIEEVSFRKLVDIKSTTSATFGLYKYPAKFIPHVVQFVLEKYAEPKMTIFDPFGGYGTVGTISKIFGNDYEMWDLNPMIDILHPISIMDPIKIDIPKILKEIKNSNKKFVPDWERHSNWFKNEFLVFLYSVWGYYHSLQDKKIKMILTIPLLKTTRYFSYDDMQRQKLSKSRRSEERVEKIIASDWKLFFFQMLEKEIIQIKNKQEEYAKLNPKKIKYKIQSGVNVMNMELKENKDILITSPPYLQSQEYMRQAKLDLYWLGFSEKKVRELSRLEIPYGKVDSCPIYSTTYEKCLNQIDEEHIKKIFQNYFWSVIGTFTRLQEKINSRMFIFVGRSSTRGKSIPIDLILIEHISKLGWVHEKTLSDKIVSRRLFQYSINPSSKRKDTRTNVENLIIFKRN